MRIIVLGFLIREPTGGQAWHYLHYLLGLAELGHDAYYIEDSGDSPMCLDPHLTSVSTDATYGLGFAAAAFARLGLGDRWAYYDAHSSEWKGARAADARELCRTADVVLNVSGVNPLRSWLEKTPVRVFIDTDPGFTQVWNLTGSRSLSAAKTHTAFFSFGENLGKPSCSVPDDGLLWQPTRQPIALSAWLPSVTPPDRPYTTVMQWKSFPDPFEFEGLRLAMKAESFRPFIDLPRQTGAFFELAVRGAPPDLRAAGWDLADIDAVSADPWTYQSFVRESKAEFGIAKAGYVVTRCGWLSERSANYLASGRPVMAQDTGFSDSLPTGEGLLAFSLPEDVVSAMTELNAHYDVHRRAARAIAEEYFDASLVLSSLLDRAASTDLT